MPTSLSGETLNSIFALHRSNRVWSVGRVLRETWYLVLSWVLFPTSHGQVIWPFWIALFLSKNKDDNYIHIFVVELHKKCKQCSIFTDSSKHSQSDTHYLFYQQVNNEGKDTHTHTYFLSLVKSRTGGWANLKSRSQITVLPGLAHRCRHPSIWIITCCLPGHTFARSWNQEYSQYLNPAIYCNLRCHHLKEHLDSCVKQPSLYGWNSHMYVFFLY